MAKITKIIFDNDGVNIDSEHIAMGDMDEFAITLVGKYVDLETVGLKERDVYINYKGVSSNQIVKSLIEEHNLPVEVIREDYGVSFSDDLYEALSELHTQSVIRKFKSGDLFTLPGFVPTMEAITEKFGQGNIAICTTSRADRMHATEHAADPDTGNNAGWGHFFPDEDNLRLSGYGHANKYLHFRDLHPDWKPEETVVVEDTAGSTKKAIEAGFSNVIGIVASKFQCETPESQQADIQKLVEAGAAIVVTDYADIPKAIEYIESGMDMNNMPDFKKDVHFNNRQIATIGLNTPSLNM